MELKVDRIRGHSFIGSMLNSVSQVVDLGMNEGRFASEIQRKYKCRVQGVEANPALLPQIAGAGFFNSLNLAVSASPGVLNFYIDPKNSEASSLTPQPGSQMVSIQTITLPDLLARTGIEIVDLLK